MLLFVVKKLARAVTVLIAVTFAMYAILFSNGPGIARGVLGTSASQSAVVIETAKLGLNRPLLVQYGDWLGGVVTGNLGSSFFTGQPVTQTLSARLPVTLALIVLALICTVIISVLLGVAAAVYGGWIDRLIQFLAVLGAAVPSFIIGIALVFGFALRLRLFPATGYVSPSSSVSGWAASITLPVIALLIGSVASAASQFRGEVRDTLSRDYVRTLRARGISERAVLFRNVLRNSAGPGLTVLSLTTIYLVGGVVLVEQIFALPGMGSLTNTSAQQGDVPIVMGCVLATILIVLIVNLLGDLANAALNPKVRTR